MAVALLGWLGWGPRVLLAGWPPGGQYPPGGQPGWPQQPQQPAPGWQPQPGYPPQGAPGYPPQGAPGYPQPGYPPQGYPQPGYPPQGGWQQPPPGGGPPWTPGAPPPKGGGRTGLVVGIVILVLLLVGGGVAAFLLLRDDGDAVAAGEIFLEPAAAIGMNPFTNEFAASDPPERLAPTLPTEEARITPRISVAFDSFGGDLPGLYGGTRDQTRCDPAMLIDFLEGDPAKAAAWVEALNADPSLRWSGGDHLEVGDIAAYIRELTPVDLRDDTRVTNHGYADGRPTRHQSVLQAGTAVLVDAYGVPRVRCACGNPLLPPVPVPEGAVYTGPVWPGFDPIDIVVINQTTTVINIFVLTDIDSEEEFSRPAGTTGGEDGDPGGGPTATPTPTGPEATPTPMETMTVPEDVVVGSGDVQVTLLWSHGSDLDLHVIDPEGTEIFFGGRESPSGGMLDVDAIPSCGDTGTSVENVFWPEGGAPSGGYQVFVDHFRGCGEPGAYQLTVVVGGRTVIAEQGSLGESEQTGTFEFSVE